MTLSLSSVLLRLLSPHAWADTGDTAVYPACPEGGAYGDRDCNYQDPVSLDFCDARIDFANYRGVACGPRSTLGYVVASQNIGCYYDAAGSLIGLEVRGYLGACVCEGHSVLNLRAGETDGICNAPTAYVPTDYLGDKDASRGCGLQSLPGDSALILACLGPLLCASRSRRTP